MGVKDTHCNPPATVIRLANQRGQSQSEPEQAMTWQAPNPRSRWAGQARLGPPQQGQEGRLYDALRRFLPVIGRADLAEAPVLDLQAAAQAISDHHGGPLSRPRRPWQKDRKDTRQPDPEQLPSKKIGNLA